ncbi:phospholipase D-like domain-containing protein [Rugamonas sp. A1-17]|nr:phospholipase D-like domain-containing protein [Rugamonas sp. A1-17]
MTIELKCYSNCDDVFMAWQVSDNDGQIAGCLGFAIEVKDSNGKVEALHNLKGFQADHPKTGQTQPTTTWPLQTYTWTDHTILIDSKVQFQVTAMVGAPGQLKRGPSSGWSPVIGLSTRAGENTCAFFNRGMIMSQFVSRYARENKLTTVQELKSKLSSDVDSPLMQFLTGELGKAIRGLVQRAQQDPSIELYCAMFELDLDDLIEDLAQVGTRAHVLLANGSVKVAGGDENSAAAQKLTGKVDLHRRMTAPHGLAHNKFVVVCQDGKPFGVLTGSTNWTLTGLHTQINNAISIENAKLAQVYLDQWHALVEAGDAFPPALKAGNSRVREGLSVNRPNDTLVWFTPVPQVKGAVDGDIAELKALVNAAKEGILFVMFMPGQEPLDSILQQQQNGLYVRGVVSTLPDGTKDNPSATFKIMTGDSFKEYKLDVVQPQGAAAAGDFVSTFTRQQFLSGMGFAITHSKVIVIDPFGDNPVVVTGSHNLSSTASGGNDENLLIIRNCPELAQAYAVNCMSVYQHYRWPSSQHEAAQQPAIAGAASGYLNTGDAWQAKRKNADVQADLKFWS